MVRRSRTFRATAPALSWRCDVAEPRHWYLVLYDVSDPPALRQVNKTLKGWGKPLQYSGRVTPGRFRPEVPTDPDVQNSRIRLLASWIR
jgi:hypothetical protein